MRGQNWTLHKFGYGRCHECALRNPSEDPDRLMNHGYSAPLMLLQYIGQSAGLSQRSLIRCCDQTPS